MFIVILQLSIRSPNDSAKKRMAAKQSQEDEEDGLCVCLTPINVYTDMNQGWRTSPFLIRFDCQTERSKDATPGQVRVLPAAMTELLTTMTENTTNRCLPRNRLSRPMNERCRQFTGAFFWPEPSSFHFFLLIAQEHSRRRAPCAQPGPS